MGYYLEYDENDGLNHYLDFFKELGDEVSKLVVQDAPFLGGEWEKDYDQFLKDVHLEDSELAPDELAAVMADYFKGLIRWHYPFSFFNVKSPINIYGAAAGALSMLYDGNLANDKICGKMASAELEVVSYLAEVAGYDVKESGGYFTFGGTSTLLNAVKMGINEAVPGASDAGLREDVFIVCSEQEHHSIIKCCNWLGIGKDNCIMIETDEQYKLDIQKTESAINERIMMKQKLLAIIVCGGTTVQNIIDPIKEIYEMRRRITERHHLDYMPHIHLDTVVGWPMLFFHNYSFKDNPQHFRADTLKLLEGLYHELRDINLADSFGVDLHKTGFCPFCASVFMVKNKKNFFKLNGVSTVDIQSMQYGTYNSCDYVLETSRPLTGVIASLTVLKQLGKNGMRSEIAKTVDANLMIRSMIKEVPGFEILNPATFGINIIFIVKPQGLNCNYDDLPDASATKVYRLAKYNYDFYLYSLREMDKSHLFINYSSGYDKGRNGIFMGVLQMQSFSPLLNMESAGRLVCMLQELKENFDKGGKIFEKTDLVFKVKPFKYSCQIKTKQIRENPRDDDN